VVWGETLPAVRARELLEVLVAALDVQGDPVRQTARTNQVVGVLKDALDDPRPLPAAEHVTDTIQALRGIAQGAIDRGRSAC